MERKNGDPISLLPFYTPTCPGEIITTSFKLKTEIDSEIDSEIEKKGSFAVMKKLPFSY